MQVSATRDSKSINSHQLLIRDAQAQKISRWRREQEKAQGKEWQAYLVPEHSHTVLDHVDPLP